MVKGATAAFFQMELVLGRGGSRLVSSLLRPTSAIARAPIAAAGLRLCHQESLRPNVNLFETCICYRTAQSRCLAPLEHIPTNCLLVNRNLYKNVDSLVHRYYSAHPNKDCYNPSTFEKPTVFQKMKQMTKDYWHILIPVHVVTSVGWIALFYTAAKNGVDVVGVLESMKLSEKYIEPLRGSSAGHWAVAYALYKIFTPVRYTVTVGGTTVSIRYLNRWGYLKPKPTSQLQSKQCITEHKEKFSKTSALQCKEEQRQTDPRKT